MTALHTIKKATRFASFPCARSQIQKETFSSPRLSILATQFGSRSRSSIASGKLKFRLFNFDSILIEKYWPKYKYLHDDEKTYSGGTALGEKS